MNTNELTIALIEALHTCKAMRNEYLKCALQGDKKLDEKADIIYNLIMKQRYIIRKLQKLIDEE